MKFINGTVKGVFKLGVEVGVEESIESAPLVKSVRFKQLIRDPYPV
jgi:hypothetical protein